MLMHPASAIDINYNNKFLKKSLFFDNKYYNNNCHNNMGERQHEKKENDQLLALINSICITIKSGELNTQLSDCIFALCQQLKTIGQHLEQSHKNELNNVFAALRRACCRDNDQLGTVCRLRIMELIELRAMNWRPNLAHTQYYLNRLKICQEQEQKQEIVARNFVSEISNKNQISANEKIKNLTLSSTSSSSSFDSTGLSSLSQTQVQNILSPQFPRTPQVTVSPSQDVYLPTHLREAVADGYFIIPARATAIPMISISGATTNVLQSPPLPQSILPPPSPIGPAYLINSLNNNSNVRKHAFVPPMIPVNTNLTVNSLINQGIPCDNKTLKLQQIREEMVIRNSDSGKVMGVRGRRVAMVEELSNTVISFQKVEPKTKDRVLTVTGSTMECINEAKRLIEETIRRNVSPNRLESMSKATNELIKQVEEKFKRSSDNTKETNSGNISIQTNNDGSLTLSCSNSQVLEAAQVALNKYLNQNLQLGQIKQENETNRNLISPECCGAFKSNINEQSNNEDQNGVAVSESSIESANSTIKCFVNGRKIYQRDELLRIRDAVSSLEINSNFLSALKSIKIDKCF